MISKQGITAQCFFRPKKFFRMLFPKKNLLLNNFESSLTERLKKLIPQNTDEILTLPWMILAMELLYDTHNDINILITDLKLHYMTDSEHGYWFENYMNINTKLLDLCNAFMSLLRHMNHGIVCLKFLRHKLEMKSEDLCTEICSALDSWRENITAEISKCREVLGRYVESLNFHKCLCDSFVEFRQRYFAYICLEAIIVEKRFLGFADYQGDDLVQESFKESIEECKEEVEKLEHGLDEIFRKIGNLSDVTFKGREIIRDAEGHVTIIEAVEEKPELRVLA
ncbi:BPS1-like protein [Arabidopsis thaliana]|uniref:BPS1-like protein n=1 Tax=Arabidopsis thaliana TaxID=3702 RepID=F4JEB0_ARATH|nr:BPS1-like protein [Arabidopsis thaliana]AEE80214.1 BPS1-like protein [Arabidopsis thaliana]|eukprot:NP_191709.5 BPS1-like protein [Arabidopsis thaliana]